MYIRELDQLPEAFSRNKKTFNNKIKAVVQDFYDSGSEYAEIVYDDYEYAASSSVYSGARHAVMALDLPIDVFMLRGGVYLRRRD